MKHFLVLALLLSLTSTRPAHAAINACSNIALGDQGALNGFVPSPNDAWHQDITNAPVDPMSSIIFTTDYDLGGQHLHPDFGYIADGYGIPYTVVDSSVTPNVPVPITYYFNDSDASLFPMSPTTPIEGNPGQCVADYNDRHAIVLDKNQCVAYELYQAEICNGKWSASGATIWDMLETEQRPYGLSSTDAAGLSVFEGLVRYDEIVAGSINHAIRFTAKFTKNDGAGGYFTAPATHAAGNLWGTNNVIGMRIRLKANFDISGFSATNQIILKAMKQYGMILADNGSTLFFQGTPDARWNDGDLQNLQSVTSAAFDVVQMGPVYDDYTAPTGSAPQIVSFTPSANNVAPGTSVVLTPVVLGDSYHYVEEAGFLRSSITVRPAVTTTYTLDSRNAFGTSQLTTTITVLSSNAPALSFTGIANQTYGVAPFAISATSNSPGVITYSVVSGPALLSGNMLTPTGVGTVILQANQAASGSYSSGSTTVTFNVYGTTPNLVFAAIPSQLLGAAPFTVSATSNSSGAITFSVMSGPATLAGSSITLTATGNVLLVATQAASGNFAAGFATLSFAVTATITPNLTFNAIPTQIFGVAPFTISTTSNSAGEIAYSVLGGPATLAGSVLTLTGSGNVTLQARQAAAAGYGAATASISFTVTGVTPSVTFATITNQTYGVAAFPVSATSNSNGAITYTVAAGPATLAGDVVTLTGSGTVTLKATQAASGGYTAATTSTTFNVNPAAPTLAFATIPGQVFSATPFLVFATSNSSGAIDYAVLSGPATMMGNLVTLTGSGAVTLQATIAAAAGYTSAMTSATFSVGPAVSALTLTPIANQTFGAPPFTVSATSTSSGALSYTVLSGPASIAGNLVTLNGVGGVTLQASQAATAGYGATTASTNFNVTAAVPTLAFPTLPSETFGATPFPVSAISNSSGAITYSIVTGPATLAGNVVTLIGSGSVTLQASQAAATNYLATTVKTTFSVALATPTLTFTPIPNQVFGAAPFTVSAISNSPGPVSYAVLSGPATLAGNIVTLSGSSLVTIQAQQAATNGYTTATSTISFNVISPPPATLVPTLSFLAIPPQILGVAPFSVAATSASTGAVTYAVLSGPANLTGNILTITGVGTINLQAYQAPDSSYAAVTANISFLVQPAPFAPAGDFTLPTSLLSVTLTRGQSAGLLVLVSSINNFTGTVAITCKLPASIVSTACSATDTQLAAASTADSRLTFTTQPLRAGLGAGKPVGHDAKGLGFLALLIPFTFPLWHRRRGNLHRVALGLLLGALLSMTLTGCGYTGYPATEPGTYNVVVQGTSGSISHSINVTIVIQ